MEKEKSIEELERESAEMSYEDIDELLEILEGGENNR